MAAAKEKSFEKQMERLEEIVSMLEQGDAPLDKSLALFEEGAGLVKNCNEILDKAEQKVVQLCPEDDKEPEEIPF